eukprot:TRINITY_DN7298_c0_g1_i2.p1 TRINITY_DN7298_c0_g1~~TRINITY_DN7298_c0_g1_i2.p1  ORF type:complete len:483 (+),score=164.02 TRINITY_DN7298_c0_g1_i2:61-1509(+)
MGCLLSSGGPRERWLVVKREGPHALPRTLSRFQEGRAEDLWMDLRGRGVRPDKRLYHIAVDLLDAAEGGGAKKIDTGLSAEEDLEFTRTSGTDERVLTLRLINAVAKVVVPAKLDSDSAMRAVGHSIGSKREKATLVFTLANPHSKQRVSRQELGTALFAVNGRRPKRNATKQQREQSVEAAHQRWCEVADLFCCGRDTIVQSEFVEQADNLRVVMCSADAVADLDSEGWKKWMLDNETRIQRTGRLRSVASSGDDADWDARIAELAQSAVDTDVEISAVPSPVVIPRSSSIRSSSGTPRRGNSDVLSKAKSAWQTDLTESDDQLRKNFEERKSPDSGFFGTKNKQSKLQQKLPADVKQLSGLELAASSPNRERKMVLPARKDLPCITDAAVPVGVLSPGRDTNKSETPFTFVPAGISSGGEKSPTEDCPAASVLAISSGHVRLVGSDDSPVSPITPNRAEPRRIDKVGKKHSKRSENYSAD